MKIAKKVIFIVLMILIFGITKAEAQTGKINHESIVLREDATTSSEALAEGYEGEEVQIIEKVDDWYKVEYKDKTGYIREDLIDLVEEEKKTEEEVTERQEEKQEEKTEEKQEEKKEEKKTEETVKKDEENNKQNEQKENAVNPIGEKQLNKDTVCRIVPCIYSSKLGELKAGTKVTVQKVLGSWSLIKYEGNKSGWVPTKLLKEISTEEETKQDVQEGQEEANEEYNSWIGYISVSEANVRKEANTDSDIVVELERNNSIEIIGETEDWYKVLYGEEEAYIAKRLVSDSITAEEASRNQANRASPESEEIKEYDEETTSIYEDIAEEEVYEELEEETYVPASSVGAEVVSKAMEYLGYDYVYGGSGPYSFDCSGFTMYIYEMFGVYMGHGATMQSSEGSYVPKDKLQPGDLLIFRDWDNEDIGHCGIYIGGGEFIHAANPSRGVVIDTIDSGYYEERYVSGRRVV